jgi:hypothetical protein
LRPPPPIRAHDLLANVLAVAAQPTLTLHSVSELRVGSGEGE